MIHRLWRMVSKVILLLREVHMNNDIKKTAIIGMGALGMLYAS